MTKSAESLVQGALIHSGIEVTDEEVGADVDLLLVAAGLVHSNWLPKELDAVHDFARIVGVLLRLELSKPIALMRGCDAVLGQVYICDRPSLEHELPHERIGATVVKVADVAGRILVAVLLRWTRHVVLQTSNSALGCKVCLAARSEKKWIGERETTDVAGR